MIGIKRGGYKKEGAQGKLQALSKYVTKRKGTHVQGYYHEEKVFFFHVGLFSFNQIKFSGQSSNKRL